MASDGDDGGSFWATFGGPAGGLAEESPLERLLQDGSCSVEALLDEEEIIQEFKAGNDRLVARLSEPAALKVLLEFVTCEPPEQATKNRCFRYPFVAVELMTCGPDQFFQALVAPDHPEVLDSLWGFLEATPAHEVNPVLAGYFSRTAASVISKHPTEVVEYLRKRGTDTLLERFLERLHLRSLAELFARLLCADEPAHVVFPVEGLVERLWRRLEDSGPDGDTQENVTLVILELLAQKDSISSGDEVLRQLTSPSSVGFLIDHIFSGGPGGISAATQILSNVVIHTYVALKGISVCASTPTLSPLSPPPLASSLAEEDIVNVGADDPVVGEAAPARMMQSPPRSPSAPPKAECPAMWLEARSGQLMRELCVQLPRICGLLDAALESSAQIHMPQGCVKSVGSTAFEAVSLLSMLAKTGSPLVLEALLQQQLLPRCLELFFRHAWSSLLHNAVRSLFSEVLAATEGVPPALVLAVLQEGGLLARIVAEYREEGRELGGCARGRPPRVGYMGHLHAMCRELQDYGARVAECGAALQAADGWVDVVLPAIEASQKVQAERLGGEISAEDRGLASSSASALSSPHLSLGATTAQTGLDQDFVLDDLSDLDERSLGAVASSGSQDTAETAPPSATRPSLQPQLPQPDDLFDPETFPAAAAFSATDAFSAGDAFPAGAQAPGVASPADAGWPAASDPWIAQFDDVPSAAGAPAAGPAEQTAAAPAAAFGVTAPAGSSPAALQTPAPWSAPFEAQFVQEPAAAPVNSPTLAADVFPIDAAQPHGGAPAGADSAFAGSELFGVGTENLFALLGEGSALDSAGALPAVHSSAGASPSAVPAGPMAVPAAAVAAPRPAPAASSPVAADPHPSPAHGGNAALALQPADLAAFDPLFQPSTCSPGAAAAGEAASATLWGGQPAARGDAANDLSALGALWPQSSGSSA